MAVVELTAADAIDAITHARVETFIEPAAKGQIELQQ